ITLDDAPRVPGGVAARLVIENSGVGHRFPTYVTPLVLLRGELVDAAGHALAGTRVERRIGREVTLDLEREVSDTRLAPGERAEPGVCAAYSISPGRNWCSKCRPPCSNMMTSVGSGVQSTPASRPTRAATARGR